MTIDFLLQSENSTTWGMEGAGIEPPTCQAGALPPCFSYSLENSTFKVSLNPLLDVSLKLAADSSIQLKLKL